MKDIINILITQRKFAKLQSITKDPICASLCRAHADFRAQLQCNNMREALITLLVVRPQQHSCPPVSSKYPRPSERRVTFTWTWTRFRPINLRKRTFPFKPLLFSLDFACRVCANKPCFHIHALHIIKYLQQTMSSKKLSMFFWLSLYTSDNFPIFLPPSLPFCNVLNTFMLLMCSFLALLFGACGRGCNSQLSWNHLVNHAHLHPISLMPAVQKAPTIHARLLLMHRWATVTLGVFLFAL